MEPGSLSLAVCEVKRKMGKGEEERGRKEEREGGKGGRKGMEGVPQPFFYALSSPYPTS